MPETHASETNRDQLAGDYLETLLFDPYPVQQEALLAWFTCRQGVLVCAPTGTGKTLIAEAAMFEAFKTGRQAYYTTPLIALTEQKLQELRAAVIRWGGSEDDVGLVTGNRRVNPDAPLLVVVAEILFNRLLHREAFDFSDVSAVVMDEFHSFNDPERGIVWELSLGLLPEHIRLLLLSATVGNALPFTRWMDRCHCRRLELVQSEDRKVPLSYQWVGDALLHEQLESMAGGSELERRTPALVFCFNREECWNVAELLKGKRMLADGQQKQLVEAIEHHDWSQGAGPKLKQILMRGVGVHHAGLLPQYKRIVEDLFQRKLLSVTVCTETLAAGLNLPARSVVIPNLLKGPPGKKKVIEPSAAHQMFGRAGRPQFDTQGFVYALAHEDDVKILRWREKYDQIPEDTKDPGLRRQKKALKKKMPKRRDNQQYWSQQQFEKLVAAPPSELASRGPLPWRLLAYLVDASAEVERVRQLVSKRLMDPKQIEAGLRGLDKMLVTLWRAGYVTLEPDPLLHESFSSPPGAEESESEDDSNPDASESADASPAGGLFSDLLQQAAPRQDATTKSGSAADQDPADSTDEPEPYRAEYARPTELLPRLLAFRGVNPLYGVFLINQLGIADRAERIQAIESVLELPRSVGPAVRVPEHDQLPPGTLQVTRLDGQLLQLGLATEEELTGSDDEDQGGRRFYDEDRVYVLKLGHKLRRLFDHDFPGVHGVYTQPVWVVGELLEFGGDFNKYVTSHRLQKQEGIIFRHLLRFILMVAEFASLCPPETTEDEWQEDLLDIRDRIVGCCHQVDALSTDKTLEALEAGSGGA